MTGETRTVCVYAMANLKKNSTKLMVVMCIGIALALYGIYVQTRTHSNPNYMPSLSLAGHWLYHNIGQRIAHPTSLLSGNNCKQGLRDAASSGAQSFLMRRFVKPLTRYSGLLNGSINVGQIILLQICAKSIRGADATIGLSAVGLFVSLICLVGSFATCKLMCISCLGLHHAVIIHLAIARRRILKNILCPSSSESRNCNGGQAPGATSGPGASSGTKQAASSSSSSSVFGSAAKKAATTDGSHSSNCSTRLRKPAERSNK